MTRDPLRIVRIVFMVIASTVALASLAFCFAYQGDPPTPPGFHIINHTHTRLDIVQLVSGGAEAVRLQLEPGEEKDSQIPCRYDAPLEARTPSGEVVAKMGQLKYEECNQDPWIIGLDSG